MRLLPFIFCLSFLLYAQDLKPYLDRLEAGEYSALREELPALKKQYQNNPELAYLSAALEENGEAAVIAYQNFLAKYPEHALADNAFRRLIEYQFTMGLYLTTIKSVRELLKRYPHSDQISQSVQYLLSSFVVVNQKDSANFYFDYYQKRYPDMDFSFYSYRPGPQYIISEAEPTTILDSSAGGTNLQKYSVQVGVFSSTANALAMRDRLLLKGYQATVAKRVTANGTFLAVRVGSFETGEAAKKFGDKLKATQNLDFIIVQIQ
jgi:outer membrane protein assembly factor BamD (BamD/ComL family)